MKSKLFLIALLLMTINSFAQKLYVWCPRDLTTTPRQSFLENDTLDVVIFDGRILNAKSKIECTPEETASKMIKFIKETYPSAIINVLAPSLFYKDPTPKRVTIKIGISAFHAAFGADVKVGIGSVGGNFSYGIFPEGKWNAVTAFAVKVYDYRNNKETKNTKDILRTAARPNTGGYITAKNILNTSYIEASQEMLFFIDESLMK